MESWTLVALTTLHVIGALDIHKTSTVAAFPTESACLAALQAKTQGANDHVTYQCREAAPAAEEPVR